MGEGEEGEGVYECVEGRAIMHEAANASSASAARQHRGPDDEGLEVGTFPLPAPFLDHSNTTHHTTQYTERAA